MPVLNPIYPEGGGGGTGNVSSTTITDIEALDKATWEALPEKPETTLYVIRG